MAPASAVCVYVARLWLFGLREDFELLAEPGREAEPGARAQVSVECRDLAMIAGDTGRWARAKNLSSQAQRFLLTLR